MPSKVMLKTDSSSSQCRSLSAPAAADPASNFSAHRTDQSDPRLHTIKHKGRLYTVPPDIPLTFGKEKNLQENRNAINYFAPNEFTNRLAVLYNILRLNLNLTILPEGATCSARPASWCGARRWS